MFSFNFTGLPEGFWWRSPVNFFTMLSRIPSWLKSKYVLTSIAFVLWILFFDRNDIFTQMERARDLRALEKSKAYYTQQIALTKKELEQLNTSPAALEKFAREKFFMKKDNEDVFLIEPAAKADDEEQEQK